MESFIDGPATVLDLFSGIGGFSLALERQGFETVGFSEICSVASKILARRWPEVPNLGDVRTFTGFPCDVVAGGFPCQPFSVAGKQRGARDNRFIWPPMLDVVTGCNPAFVIVENVDGIIDMELDRVLTDLEAAGFRTQSFAIPACAVDARHIRERVWIIAENLAYTVRERRRRGLYKWKDAAYANPCCKVSGARSNGARWPIEPALCRMAYGLPGRLDRIKALGNSIVPQIAEIFGYFIRERLNARLLEGATAIVFNQ